jgi:cell division protein FtsL
MPVRLKGGSLGRRLVISVLGLGLLALVVHTVFSDKGYLELRKQQQEVEQLQAEIQRLEQENQRLLSEIQQLKTDPQAVERVAREQLKMARPGEKVIILPDKESPKSDRPDQESNP